MKGTHFTVLWNKYFSYFTVHYIMGYVIILRNFNVEKPVNRFKIFAFLYFIDMVKREQRTNIIKVITFVKCYRVFSILQTPFEQSTSRVDLPCFEECNPEN